MAKKNVKPRRPMKGKKANLRQKSSTRKCGPMKVQASNSSRSSGSRSSSGGGGGGSIPPEPLGKANSLPGKAWETWLRHLKTSAGPAMFVVCYLTAALCLRVSQASGLKSEDFDFHSGTVYCRPFKGHPECHKCMPPSVLSRLKAWRLTPVTGKPRSRLAGGRGRVKVTPRWTWPKAGYLFPSRSGASLPYWTKDVIGKKIRDARADFCARNSKRWPQILQGDIRSHSGRRHVISLLAGEGMPSSAGMEWSQIESERVYRGYQDANSADTKRHLLKVDKKLSLGKLR